MRPASGSSIGSPDCAREHVVPRVEAGDLAADREARAQPRRELGGAGRHVREARVGDERGRVAVVDDVAGLVAR